MNIQNIIETYYRELVSALNDEYVGLYKEVKEPKISIIFSTLHSSYITLLKSMNTRLPTKEFTAHYWAEQSRNLLATIEVTEDLQRKLKNTQFAFKLDNYYQEIINKCKLFLKSSLGSEIPSGMEKVELYYSIPIFIIENNIFIPNVETKQSYELKQIGEGSYALVFKYKDEFYNRNFVIKRAKKDLEEKEIRRFKLEYEEMNKLKSPYVVEVYNYNETKNEYIMEHMDCTLSDYIQKNNSILDKKQRKSIMLQVLKAFVYLSSKELLHRDISPHNILIKEYDDCVIVKISDFGLVKIPDSNLTTFATEFKGGFNDPSLMTEGFSTYNILHEIYALTRLIFYIITGRTNTDNIKIDKLRRFVEKGLNSDKNQRFKSIEELSKNIKSIWDIL